jgi:hypothetical protein
LEGGKKISNRKTSENKFTNIDGLMEEDQRSSEPELLEDSGEATEHALFTEEVEEPSLSVSLEEPLEPGSSEDSREAT